MTGWHLAPNRQPSEAGWASGHPRAIVWPGDALTAITARAEPQAARLTLDP